MPHSDFLKRIGIDFPIIQGPMGGGPSTPELVAAVSNAGGLGFLGVAYLKPAEIAETIKAKRALTNKPFGANLFVGTKAASSPDPQPMLDLLGDVHRRLQIPPPVLPPQEPDPFPAQFEAVLAARPDIFSFTFGIPDRETLSRCKTSSIYVMGTATTVEEAQKLEQAGVDAIVLQGEEAGAHRGTFLAAFENSMVPLVELLKATVKTVSLPLIAAGGLMDGRDIARVLELGAAAAQLGTAFLPCPETGVPEAYKKAVLTVKQDTTLATRAFSGRPSRGLRNRFIEMLDGHEEMILPFPIQNTLTRPMRVAAAKQGNSDYLSLWAGRGVARARQMPAAQLILTLVDEMNDAGS